MEEHKKRKVQSELSKYLFFFGLLIITGGIVSTMPRLAIPLTLSYICYLILDPLIPTLIKLGARRNFAITFIFVGILVLMSIPIIKLIPVIRDDAQDIQRYIPIVEEYLRLQYQKLSEIVFDKSGYQMGDRHLVAAIEYGKSFMANLLVRLPEYLGSFLELIFVVPLFLFFMMKDGRNFKKFFLTLVPNSFFERFYSISYQFNKKIGDYIFAKIIEAGVVQVIITIGLWIIDVRFSILFGLAAGVTNIIPYLGPVLGAVPAIIFGLVEYGATPTLWAIVVLYLVANVIDIAFIFPVLVSKIVDLHPIIVVIAVILGSQYLGVVGMVISVPVAVAIKLILSQLYHSLYFSSERR